MAPLSLPLHPRPVILGPGDRAAPAADAPPAVDDAPERVSTTHTSGFASVVPPASAASPAPLTPAQRLRAQLLRHADEARALADAVTRDCPALSAADAPYTGNLVRDAGLILDGIAGACGLARAARRGG